MYLECYFFFSYSRIDVAKEEIKSSDVLSSALASLREGIKLLNDPEIAEIYCLGLGHIGERIVPRYQLSLLLCIKDVYNVRVLVHDPIFYTQEKEILKKLGLTVLEENQEGKYKSNSDSATLFFLPHCPKQLTNNLLWSNWNLKIKNCIIIANSFNTIVEENTKDSLVKSCNYLTNILTYTVELPIINTFKYYDVFNDTAIHIFPFQKLKLIPEDFWNNCSEPVYDSDNTEFITNTFRNIQL